MASVGSKITAGGGAISFIGFMTSSQGAALIGVAVAILGALITWWYKRRDSLQLQKESLERMRLAQVETESRMKREEDESKQRIAHEQERLQLARQEHEVKMAKYLAERTKDN